MKYLLLAIAVMIGINVNAQQKGKKITQQKIDTITVMSDTAKVMLIYADTSHVIEQGYQPAPDAKEKSKQDSTGMYLKVVPVSNDKGMNTDRNTKWFLGCMMIKYKNDISGKIKVIEQSITTLDYKVVQITGIILLNTIQLTPFKFGK